MFRAKILGGLLLIGGLAVAQRSTGGSEGLSPEIASRLEQTLADVIREAIPAEHEKKDGWGRTKEVTSGVNLHGSLFHPRIERRKKQRRHGLWKQYRVTLVNPEEELQVHVENLRPMGVGQVAARIVVDGRIDGWAQARAFNRGLHLGTLSMEGESRVRITIDCEVGLATTFAPPAVEVSPRIVDARLELDEFRLKRLGKLHGDPADVLGKGLREVVEELFDGKRLTAKLNRAIDKKRDRLRWGLGGGADS